MIYVDLVLTLLAFNRVTSDPVLSDIDLHIHAGEKIAICGRTGRFVFSPKNSKEYILMKPLVENPPSFQHFYESSNRAAAPFSLMA